MTHMNSYEQPLDFWVLVPQTNLDGCWNSPRKYPRYGSSSDRELMIFDTLRWNGVPIRWNSYVKFRGQKDHRFSAAWPVVCLSVSLWGILSPCLSERGWIARARHSESRRYMMVKQVGSPPKTNASTIFGCHLTISPRSAAFIFSQATIFSPSRWFFHPYFPANKLCIFHVFPHIFPKKIRRFSPVRRCPHNRCRTTTWAEARAWERTPEQPKRARCVGWFAWRRKWGPLGPLVGWG